MRLIAAIVLPVALVAGSVVSASASPVCADPPREPCGGRIFPEAVNSVSFLQYDDGEYEEGVLALAEEFPRYVRARTLSEVRGRESLSAGGREIWLVEVTDFEVPEKNKRPVVVSLSVHGAERAGLEGGIRYAEDLARWATNEPDHEMANGTEPDSTTMPVRKVLKKVHLYLTDINPDGWAQGDIANGGAFMRGNEGGVDLNREFPTKGWTEVNYTPLSESESKAWDDVARDIRPVTASDLHGELTSANNVYADIMLPAGQWNPLEQAREERLARHMKSNVERYFDIHAIPREDGLGAAEYATGYDVVGYDDSGFMGDYFTEQLGATEVDVEHLLSHMVPNSTWVSAHENAHIAAVRGEIETLMIEAIVVNKVDVHLRLGKVGYLFDPYKVKSADGYGGPKPPNGVDPQSYKVTHMRYFKELSRFATDRLRKVESADVTAKSLKGLDSFVIAGDPFPKDPDGERVNRKKTTRVLKRFVKRDGNLVLTDGGLKLLSRLKIVKKTDIQRTIYNAGHIDIEDFDDRYLKKVHTTASQTYYEVPLGYSVAQDSAPHVTVSRDAWEAKGGKSLAYVTDEARIGLGRMRFGKGTIGILGALLPRPTERFDHFFGLADYAVTVAGGQILNNMLAAGR